MNRLLKILFLVTCNYFSISFLHSQNPIYMLEGTVYKAGNRPWYVYSNELVIIDSDSIYTDSLGRYYYPVDISYFVCADRPKGIFYKNRYDKKNNTIKIMVREEYFELIKFPKKRYPIRYFDIPIKSNSYHDNNLIDLRYKFINK